MYVLDCTQLNRCTREACMIVCVARELLGGTKHTTC